MAMNETKVTRMLPIDGDLHPILEELFNVRSSSSDGNDRSSDAAVTRHDGTPTTPLSTSPPLAPPIVAREGSAVSPLQVLNHLLATSQVSPDAVRRAHEVLSSSSKAAATTLSTKTDQVGRAGPPGGGDESSNREEGEVNHNSNDSERKEESTQMMSRRQRKKLLRKSKDSAAAVAADSSESSTSSSINFERHIALRIYYDGEKYSGLAENVGRDDDKSIEKSLFAALIKARLVVSRDTCQYSRSGRTDRGVSAAGQVVALRVKSAFKSNMRLVVTPGSSTDDSDDTNNSTRPIEEEDLPHNSFDQLRVLCPARNSSDSSKWNERVLTELRYDKIINNLLPPEIRVLGWCPVSTDFSARFSAKSRTYRYFFVQRPNLNVNLMRSALALLVGTHDFRNFCRMDVEKVYNFVRTVYQADIRMSETDSRVAWIEIHGQAFLWHQIRCIAAVLFLVGEGMEPPEVVRDLLDVEKHPGKPSYRYADDMPLVLHNCDYDNLRMGYSVPNLWNVTAQQRELEEHALICAARIRNCLASLDDAHVAVSELLAFAEGKCAFRRKKQQSKSKSSTTAAQRGESRTLSSPFGDAQCVSWGEALHWMRDVWDLAPEPSFASKDAAYIPLLKRHLGPTYEEKIANLQHSAKRKERYVSNVIKKRKTKEEDAEFYKHMARQGTS